MLTITKPISTLEKVSNVEHDRERINSISSKYPELRQQSKPITFACTYMGSYRTLMTNCGFSMDEALSIEANYHDMYKVSDKWVEDKLSEAAKVGYVSLAFGLRLRTPTLQQVILGTSVTPTESAAEYRTAGNALGQSWCMLNSRAGSECMGKIRKSVYRHSIKPIAQIHDAQYFLVKDNKKSISYLNTTLTKAMSWQDDSAIAHDTVSLGGDLSVFSPNWANEINVDDYLINL